MITAGKGIEVEIEEVAIEMNGGVDLQIILNDRRKEVTAAAKVVLHHLEVKAVLNAKFHEKVLIGMGGKNQVVTVGSIKRGA